MKRIRETIIVEGRYDKNKLKQIVYANVIETSGFGIFNDTEKRRLIRALAEKDGIIILTDSDGAGFQIRNHLRGAISEGRVLNAYIPEIEGRERRKKTASKSGLLGVEGVPDSAILEALIRAGATFEDEDARSPRGGVTKQDMYFDGLSGGEGSAERRARLAESLGLPKLMSANALLAAINMLFTREEYRDALK